MKKYYYIPIKEKIKEIENFQDNCWINIFTPTQNDKKWLIDNYKIDTDSITDILDIDEQSRYEKNDDYILFIIRTPFYEKDTNITYSTLPIGIIFLKNCVITICMEENIVIKNIIDNKIKNVNIFSKNALLLTLMLRSSMLYLYYLKMLNQETTKIENDLKKSIKNNELFDMLTIEKSLVFFTTALRSNQLLLEKLQKGSIMKFNEEENELLEDALTENIQAISMANIHSDILSGMMDAFASIISNNLNVIMKKLTSISLVLMIPTLIASIYGMNINLPFQNHVHSFFIISIGSFIISGVFFILFKVKKYL